MLISPHTKMYAIAIVLAVMSWDSRADVMSAPILHSTDYTISVVER
ncbi:hypothetical protein [Candidatus Litorirhabdus singularis]|nr:hypothetical protein [Candidatus Litorirhabdus singularis]